jgi:hypothetical protein
MILVVNPGKKSCIIHSSTILLFFGCPSGEIPNPCRSISVKERMTKRQCSKIYLKFHDFCGYIEYLLLVFYKLLEPSRCVTDKQFRCSLWFYLFYLIMNIRTQLLVYQSLAADSKYHFLPVFDHIFI